MKKDNELLNDELLTDELINPYEAPSGEINNQRSINDDYVETPLESEKDDIEKNDTYKSYIYLQSVLFMNDRKNYAIGVYFYTNQKSELKEVSSLDSLNLIRDDENKKSYLALYGIQQESLSDKLNRYRSSSNENIGTKFFFGNFNFTPIDEKPKDKKRGGVLFYTKVFLPKENEQDINTEKLLFDDFQKHTEVLKRMLKEDDEIKPFNNVNNTFTNIFANSLINNMEFKKVFNDKPFSISVMIKKNTKDLKNRR